MTICNKYDLIEINVAERKYMGKIKAYSEMTVEMPDDIKEKTYKDKPENVVK